MKLVGSPATGVTVNGPVIAPAGPTMLRTCAGVNVVGSIGRSKVTTIPATVLSVTRLSAAPATPPGTLVPTMCGPGRMIGRVDVS